MKRSIRLSVLALVLTLGTSVSALAGVASSSSLPKGEAEKTRTSAWLPLIVGGAISFGALGAMYLMCRRRRPASEHAVIEDRQFNELNQLAAARPNRSVRPLLSVLILLGMVTCGYIFRAQIASSLTEVGTTIIMPFLHVTPRPSSS